MPPLSPDATTCECDGCLVHSIPDEYRMVNLHNILLISAYK